MAWILHFLRREFVMFSLKLSWIPFLILTKQLNSLHSESLQFTVTPGFCDAGSSPPPALTSTGRLLQDRRSSVSIKHTTIKSLECGTCLSWDTGFVHIRRYITVSQCTQTHTRTNTHTILNNQTRVITLPLLHVGDFVLFSHFEMCHILFTLTGTLWC